MACSWRARHFNWAGVCRKYLRQNQIMLYWFCLEDDSIFGLRLDLARGAACPDAGDTHDDAVVCLERFARALTLAAALFTDCRFCGSPALSVLLPLFPPHCVRDAPLLHRSDRLLSGRSTRVMVHHQLDCSARR